MGRLSVRNKAFAAIPSGNKYCIQKVQNPALKAADSQKPLILPKSE